MYSKGMGPATVKAATDLQKNQKGTVQLAPTDAGVEMDWRDAEGNPLALTTITQEQYEALCDYKPVYQCPDAETDAERGWRLYMEAADGLLEMSTPSDEGLARDRAWVPIRVLDGVAKKRWPTPTGEDVARS